MSERRFRIHFTDNYGQGSFEVDAEDYAEAMKNLRDDPECDDIWVESYNEAEGYWEA